MTHCRGKLYQLPIYVPRLKQLIVQDATGHNLSLQMSIPPVTVRVPERVTGALIIFIDFLVDIMAADGLAAVQFAPHRRVTAISP